MNEEAGMLILRSPVVLGHRSWQGKELICGNRMGEGTAVTKDDQLFRLRPF